MKTLRKKPAAAPSDRFQKSSANRTKISLIPHPNFSQQKRTRRTPEATIQRAVFAHLRARGAPHVFAFHPANGGYRKPIEAAIFKSLGVVAGVPDVIAIRDGRCFALELKAGSGRATDRQLETIAALREAGAVVAVAIGIDEALRKLENWGLLLGRTQ